jgi:hypothetical protein
MKRTSSRAAGALFLALAVLVLTGTALAGNGNSANAPGQATAPGQQADATPAAQPAPAAQPSAQAPGQVKKETSSSPSSQSSSTSSPGQAKQQAKASSSTPGVKPSSATNTTKPTSCTTGSSGGSVTCAGNGPKADGSKQYGNGKTAAQIAAANGAPAGTKISGPGNSQPHKVTACGKPNNKSGGVDVHAVKSYDASACQETQVQPSVHTSSSSVCGQTTIVTQSTQVLGVLHGKSKHLMTNPNSAHFTKHADHHGLGTATSTQVVPPGESCGSSHSTESSQQVQQASAQQSSTQSAQAAAAQSLSQSQGVLSAQAPQAAQAAPASSATQATPATGGVLGATANLNAPKPHQRGGVLGAVTNVAGSSLPFTGFPLWIAVLLAIVLIGGGLALRGRGTTSRI